MTELSTTGAKQILDGLMLGDGSLAMPNASAYLSINLCGEGTLSYLDNISSALLALGISLCDGYPKILHAVSKGKPYEYSSLASRVSPILTNEYHRWYSTGRKEVPSDVRISRLALAHWFMGDGCSISDDRYKKSTSVEVSFSTYSFGESSIALLENELHRIGFSTGRNNHKGIKDGSGIRITILQRDVNSFMKIIEPCMLEPYLYKIKYRKENRHD